MILSSATMLCDRQPYMSEIDNERAGAKRGFIDVLKLEKAGLLIDPCTYP
jgi:hypothetical protein